MEIINNTHLDTLQKGRLVKLRADCILLKHFYASVSCFNGL